MKTKTVKVKKKRKESEIVFLLMLLPGVIYLIINNYLPMFGLIIAFKKINFSKGILGSDWAGFDNFKFLFKTKDAWIITRNTLLYNIVFIVLNLVLGVLFAIVLNEIRSNVLKKSYQTILLLPQVVSMVIVAYMAYSFLSYENGFINNSILKPLGMKEVSWYKEPKYWPFILTFIQAWKSIGFNTILFLASVVGIDTSLYEAAEVDGATRVQQIMKITVPLLKPTMIVLGLLSVGKIFYSDFGLFLQVPMSSGSLFNVTQTIDTYVYRGMTSVTNIGMSSAAAFYQSFVGFLVVLGSNALVRKLDSDSALF
ncbi:MAG: sugar ABC transporter permease [Lachnospiraceae bacterium]|nr:sugar ABC transporter permease [Lachnospiraceae bacterium]MBQ7600735.1 sugar ABC transporter permease [Lachnospiraceae bacterium]